MRLIGVPRPDGFKESKVIKKWAKGGKPRLIIKDTWQKFHIKIFIMNLTAALHVQKI